MLYQLSDKEIRTYSYKIRAVYGSDDSDDENVELNLTIEK